MGFAALAAVGIFAEGLAVGTSDSCCLRGIVEICQGQFKAVGENVHCSADFQDTLRNSVTIITEIRNEQF